MSRDLALLHPRLRPLCEKHLALCKAVGIDLLVTQTWRSAEEQDALYAQGRPDAQGRIVPGPIVTNAPAGRSDHEWAIDSNGELFRGPHAERPASLAYDVALVSERSPSGGVLAVEWENVPWETIGWIAIQQCGLKWGGLWKKPDRPHFYIDKREL